ncbi:MAG TPA: LCP family protein [Pseudogracilibacillus sp.]|nr:LCP family protein [Pseudogracilibacillus sp.]
MSRAKKKMSVWKILIIIAIVFILAVLGYVIAVYLHAKNTVNSEMHTPVEAIDTSIGKDKIKAGETLNILLLGIDAEEDERGRSDAIMILTIDPKGEQIQIVSIPRDTRTEIVGKDMQDKINHAYAFGGSEMAINTVEAFLDMDLDYYVSMNMDGFKSLVDELGSITVNSDMEFTSGKYDFKFGENTMDGDKTMAYVRMRKQDPTGDFGRNKRQRQVIEGIINEGASVASATKFTSVVSILGKNMETNLDMGDMQDLLLNYQNARKNISEYQMTGEGTNIDGIYYLNVDDAEIEKVRNMINELGG